MEREKKERKQLRHAGERRRLQAGNFVTEPQTTMRTREYEGAEAEEGLVI